MNKAKYMFIGSRTLLSRITFDTVIHADNTCIQSSDSLKNLDVHFDRHMLFSTHITKMTKKALGIFMNINRINEYFSVKARKIVIETLVPSIINYGVTIWSTTNKTTKTDIKTL